MGNLSIEREILIDAPIDTVWGIVTEPHQINQWFSETSEIDLRPGGAGYLAWKDFGTAPLQVEQVDRPRLFSFRWCHPEGAEPVVGNSMLVTFTLATEGAQTRLRVEETGLAEIDWDDDVKMSTAADHNGGWATNFDRIPAYVATLSPDAVR